MKGYLILKSYAVNTDLALEYLEENKDYQTTNTLILRKMNMEYNYMQYAHNHIQLYWLY